MSNQVNIRLQDDRWRALRRRAEEEGTTVAELVKRMVIWQMDYSPAELVDTIRVDQVKQNQQLENILRQQEGQQQLLDKVHRNQVKLAKVLWYMLRDNALSKKIKEMSLEEFSGWIEQQLG